MPIVILWATLKCHWMLDTWKDFTEGHLGKLFVQLTDKLAFHSTLRCLFFAGNNVRYFCGLARKCKTKKAPANNCHLKVDIQMALQKGTPNLLNTTHDLIDCYMFWGQNFNVAGHIVMHACMHELEN